MILEKNTNIKDEVLKLIESSSEETAIPVNGNFNEIFEKMLVQSLQEQDNEL